jgi:Icc-related predicted phosphoesterase
MEAKAMLILFITDIHCNTSYLEKLRYTHDVRKAEVIAVGGDVECNGEILGIIEKLGKKIFFVPGNMDDVGISKMYREKGYNIDGRVTKIMPGVMIGGVGGISVISSIKNLERQLDDLRDEIEILYLLTHHPPRTNKTDLALGKIHAGLREINLLIEKYKPKLVMHGHIHESPGFEYLGETLIVNPGPLYQGRYAVIDTEEMKVQIKKL